MRPQVDENAHAVHFFISALLQLLDRAGSLYAEIARFVLRIIFRWVMLVSIP
jgi:peroxin-13